MLRSIAEFSKAVKKYAYYPLLIGFIALLSAIVNYGKPFSIIGWSMFAICGVLSTIALLSKWLCRKAGISDRIM